MALKQAAGLYAANSGSAARDMGLGDQLSEQAKTEELARKKKLLAMGQPGAQQAYGDPGATMGAAARMMGLGPK